jgi:hypothetical protein
MVPNKLWTIAAGMLALVVAMAGCATEESTDDTDPDLDPGAGQVPLDDTNDDIGADDEDLGDEGTGNETDDTNMTGDTNTTGDAGTTP